MSHKTAKAERRSAAEVNRDVPHDEIAKRAYQHYCDRGCAPGGDVDDWLAAERELLDQDPEDATTAG